VNSARSHQTALHMAAAKQHEAVARLLVDFGADVYMENKTGLRPSALVPCHQPLYHFLHHCESMHHHMASLERDICLLLYVSASESSDLMALYKLVFNFNFMLSLLQSQTFL